MAKKTKKRKASGKRAKWNPPKTFRKVSKSTGWMRADAVRFVKRRGQPVQVLIRRGRRAKKRAKR